MSLARQIAGNTVIQVAGKFVATILGLVTIGIMTRHLGRSGYGEFTTAMTFLQFFGVMSDFGLTLTMVRMMSAAGADEPRVASNIFTFRLCTATLMYGLAPAVALLFPYPGAVKLAIAVGALSFLNMTLASLMVAVFQKHLNIRLSTISEIIGRALLLVLSIAFASAGYGLLAFVLALVIGNAVQFGLNFLFARRFVRVRLAYDAAMWREIVRQSWPIGISIIFNLIYLKSDIIILSLFRTQAEVGLYGAAYKVLDVITTIPTIFMGLVLPVLTAVWSAGQKEDFERKLGRAFEFLTMIALPLVVGAALVGRQLMAFVAGQAFAESGDYLAILMVAGAAVFWSALFGHTIVALGMQRKMMWGYGIDAILSLALYFVLIPRYGAAGAAWVTVFSEVFIAIATAVVVLRVSRARVPAAIVVKAALACVGMAGVLLLTHPAHVLIQILAGCAAYALFIWMLGGINKATLAQFLRPGTAPV